MSGDARFGPFAPVFEKGELAVAGYLELLHLRGAGVQVVIDRIATALRGNDVARWVAALLAEVNWRPHLVAAIAFLLEPTHDVELLWGAIGRGSWVIPQLVVTAAHVDPRFRARVQERVAALCPIAVPGGLTPLERHNTTGPGDRGARSAKLLASVLAMSAELSDLAGWRTEVLGDARIQALLATDRDHAERLVGSWLVAVRAAFGARGRTLVLP